jgi:hypothetical protein
MALESKKKIHKKYVLAYLFDICKSPIFIKIMKEIPWYDGLGKLYSGAFIEEPIAVSHIVNMLYRDVVIRNQLSTMMSKEDVADLLTAKDQSPEWLDPSVPSHRKRLPKHTVEESTFYNRAMMDEAIGVNNPHNLLRALNDGKLALNNTQAVGTKDHRLGHQSQQDMRSTSNSIAPVGLTKKNLQRLGQKEQLVQN